MKTRGISGFAMLLGLLWAAHGHAQEPLPVAAGDAPDEIVALTNRFQALKPTVVLQYDAAYTFLFLTFKGVAAARIALTEGLWTTPASNEPIPACQLDFRVFDPKQGTGGTNAEVRLNKRTLCVLTMPELRLLRYAKVNDEFFKPLFGKGRRVNYVETYDFESGDVRYRRVDLGSGLAVTNMPNLSEMNKQSREIADVLRSLYLAYRAEESSSATQAVPQVHFNVDGVVKTFALHTQKVRARVPILDRKTALLKGDIRPVKEDDAANESFNVACLPFRDLAESLGNPRLKVIADEGHEWYMIPVAGRYELFVGGIECTLDAIGVQDGETATNALADPAARPMPDP